jgi:hypothetical protein
MHKVIPLPWLKHKPAWATTDFTCMLFSTLPQSQAPTLVVATCLYHTVMLPFSGDKTAPSHLKPTFYSDYQANNNNPHS